MRWARRLTTLVVVMQVSGVALAEPAVNTGFVPVSTTEAGSGASVTVERGDNLWKISQSRLDEVLGREATIREVDPYWRAVVSLNRERLRSGNPDLIYPGEEVALPASTD